MLPRIFIFIGRSGSGKGTQATLLIELLRRKDTKNEVLYVSTGEEFRKIISADNFTAAKAREIVDSGRFGPAFLAVMMWAQVLTREYKKGEHLVIDGSPRTVPEAMVLGTVFGFYELSPVVIHIDVSREWASQKLRDRGRNDDTEAGISSRQNLFEKEIVPILTMYRQEKKIPMIKVNGEQAIKEVHRELLSKLTL